MGSMTDGAGNPFVAKGQITITNMPDDPGVRPGEGIHEYSGDDYEDESSFFSRHAGKILGAFIALAILGSVIMIWPMQ